MNSKSFAFCIAVVVLLFCESAFAHNMTIQKNPTNEGGIVWGVQDASGFVRWRAYIRGLSNNRQGGNSGWKSANGWWYYEIDSVSKQVMFRTTGLENQDFEITYWVFKSDGTWEFGEKKIVTQDSRAPSTTIRSPMSGEVYQNDVYFDVEAQDKTGVEWIRLYLRPPPGEKLNSFIDVGDGWFYQQYHSSSVKVKFYKLPIGEYRYAVWAKDVADNMIQGYSWFTFSIIATPEPTPEPETTPEPEPEPTPEPDIIVDPVPDPDPEPENEATEEAMAQQGGFIYPVKTDHIYRWENLIPNGEWYDYQPYGALFNYSDKVHLGADLNLAGHNDLGQPIYAINDCVVHDFFKTNVKDGWGSWIALKCDAPRGFTYRVNNLKEVEYIYVLYAHIQDLTIYKDDGTLLESSQISKGVTEVKKGWRIGTVGDANGYYLNAAHLHFEIRTTSNDIPGFGYLHVGQHVITQDYIDPIEFIQNNKVLHQKTQHFFVHPYDVFSDQLVHVELDTTIWKRQHRETTAQRRSVGYGDHMWVARSDEGTQASWNYYVPHTGWYDLYLYLPHSYATASMVKYTIWHEGSNFENPYNFTLNQARNPGLNERIYVGKFKFNADREYSVILQGSTEEVNLKHVVMDALELVYEHNDGYGGGFALSVDADHDLMDDVWEVEHGLDPKNDLDAGIDSDNDGLTNLQEYYLATDPHNIDSDADGYHDGVEVGFTYPTNPADPNDCPTCYYPDDFDDDLYDPPVTEEEFPDEVSDEVDQEVIEDDGEDSQGGNSYPSPVSVINVIGGFGCSVAPGGGSLDPILALLLFIPLIFRKRRV